jgi:predicted dienelactone hydrolase
MMQSLKSFALLIFLAVLAVACTPIQPPVETPIDDMGDTAGLTYAQPGPYAAGYMPVSVGGESERPLAAGLWYPALNPDGSEPAITYEVITKMAEMESDSPAIVYGKALADAAIDTGTAPYPLVVFSHGFGLNAATYHSLPEHYASHGFVVLAPEHMDSDWFEGIESSIGRPEDIKRTLDFAETLNAAGGKLAGLIDMDNVAVVGHSYGGYTALAAAGALFDFDALNERCAQLAEDDPKMFLCAPLLGKATELAERAGLDSVPEDLWPPIGDARVTAIIPMAGDAYMFSDEGLANITVPIMAIGGTADTGAPFDWGSEPSYDYAASTQKSLVGLEGAEHMIVASPCEENPWLAGSPLAEYLCGDPAWDKQQALDLVHHFSTAFLLDTLRGNVDAHAALLPAAAQFPAVDYRTTMQ